MLSLVGLNATAYWWMLFISQCVVAGKSKNVHAKCRRDPPAAAAVAVAAAPEVEDNLASPEAKKTKTQVAYTHEETRWIVDASMKMQALFDDKIHKNEQLWD